MPASRRLAGVLASIALAASLGACASTPVQTSPANGTSAVANDTADALTITDSLGREVTLPRNPQRVVTMIGSFADVWCLAGGHDSLVASADDTWTQFDLGLSANVANIGAVKEPSLEKVVAAEPDLVIASSKTSADVDMLDALESAGITVAYFDVSSFEDYLAMLRTCCDLTGDDAAYETHGTDVAAQVDEARAMAADDGPTVLYIRASGASVKVKGSEGSVLGEMLADLGCTNIADSDAALLDDLSLEKVLAEDPDQIFIVLQGSDQDAVRERLDAEVLSNPAWAQLTAVREGHVHYMDPALYNLKPNDRWGEAYLGLAELLYGD